MDCLKLISVIIPTKNRAEKLCEALISIKEQSYDNIEVIVIDDGSDKPILASLIESCLTDAMSYKLIRNEVSLGGARSRNMGIDVSRGEFIAFLDDDDVYYPNKLSMLMKALIQNNNYDAVFGKVVLNDGFNLRPPVRYPKKIYKKRNLRLMNLVHTNSTLIRKNSLASVRFLESLKRYQDLQFHVELSYKCHLLFVDVDVAEWMVDSRTDQVTTTFSREKMKRDISSFEILLSYFESDLLIKKHDLSIYYAKLIKMYLRDYRVIKALITVVPLIFSVARVKGFITDLKLRQKYFLRN